MTVFKTTLKILNKCKALIILYTIILIFFAGFNSKTNDNNMSFNASKPDILIINNDEDIGITKNLVDYIKNNSNIINNLDSEEEQNDALFYRDVNYIIYIPKNFRIDFLNKQNPQIEIKSTNDYQSSLAELLLERYMSVASIYLDFDLEENELINNINDTLFKEVEVEITSKLDTNALNNVTNYYNFTNYCFLAGAIYVLCLILSSFKNELISKRTTISKMNYKTINRNLLLSVSIFALCFWIVYFLLSVILFGNIMFSYHGLAYLFNSFVFSICALAISFLLGNIIIDKNALNGIINVIALGSSFLCGAFVPMSMLPKGVLNIAHILPSYWFIKSNELIKRIDVFSMNTLKPIFINMLVIILFTLVFIVIANIVAKKKRKIA